LPTDGADEVIVEAVYWCLRPPEIVVVHPLLERIPDGGVVVTRDTE